MSSHPATPQPSSRDNATDGDGSTMNSSCKLGKFRSPQVDFASVKHLRPSPHSGRGAWKKRKEVVAHKKAGLSYNVASPSELFSRSMLSFDLDAKVGLTDENYQGENELFVKFKSDRRRSTGRGTLQTLINKRIALQSSGQVLAQRQMVAQKSVQKPSLPRRKIIDPNELEIPLGQDGIIEEVMGQELDLPFPDTKPLSQELDLSFSETKQLEQESDSPISQTQVYIRSQEICDEIPFMSTPIDSLLNSISEESASSIEEDTMPLSSIREEVFVGNKFLDLEASQSEDEQDDEEDSSRSNISDLFASDDSDFSDGGNHFRLHQQWANQNEQNKFRETSNGPSRRPKRVFVRELFVPAKPAKPAKHAKPPKPKKVTPEPTEKESAKTPLIVRKTKWVKKYPNRRSSVSSCSSVVKVSRAAQRKKRDSETFSFLQAPPKKEEEIIAPQPQRLLGTKRFVFGNKVTNQN